MRFILDGLIPSGIGRGWKESGLVEIAWTLFLDEKKVCEWKSQHQHPFALNKTWCLPIKKYLDQHVCVRVILYISIPHTLFLSRLEIWSEWSCSLEGNRCWKSILVLLWKWLLLHITLALTLTPLREGCLRG